MFVTLNVCYCLTICSLPSIEFCANICSHCPCPYVNRTHQSGQQNYKQTSCPNIQVIIFHLFCTDFVVLFEHTGKWYWRYSLSWKICILSLFLFYQFLYLCRFKLFDHNTRILLILSTRPPKVPTLMSLSAEEDESALRARYKATSCSSSAVSSLSSTPANSGRKGSLSQRTSLKAESTDDFSICSEGPQGRGGGVVVVATGGGVGSGSGEDMDITMESGQILTPAARINIANRSKEALQRHQVSPGLYHRSCPVCMLWLLSLPSYLFLT